MKIAYIASGAANMYCGSCMRDNALAAAMQQLGYDVSLIPLYTPMRLDEESVAESHIFYGGVGVYMAQQFARWPRLQTGMSRLFNAQRLLRWLNRFDMGSAVDAESNGELTLSMLQGEMGNQHHFLDELVDWLATTLQPDVVHLTNTLFIGLARQIKARLDVPIICGLHGEDIYLDGLRPRHRQQAIKLIRERSTDIDGFIATSNYYATMMSDWFDLPAHKVKVVLPGISLHDYAHMTPISEEQRPLTLGYFARIDPAKGLHILADAFQQLAPHFPNLHLKVGGYLSRAHQPYLQKIEGKLAQAGLSQRVQILGTATRAEKLAFFQSIDILSVPTIYRDPKGLFTLEALASGIPVVLPNHGIFPEWIEATNGGHLHKPMDSQDLARQLTPLLQDEAYRQQLGQQGKTAVFANFSAQQMATNTIDVYKDILKVPLPVPTL